MREMLDNTDDRDVLVFIDWLALRNPGPTGVRGVVYLNGYKTMPVLPKKSVRPMSYNYTGELVGIQIDHSDLVDRCRLTSNKNYHAFDKKLPTSKIYKEYCIDTPTGSTPKTICSWGMGWGGVGDIKQL